MPLVLVSSTDRDTGTSSSFKILLKKPVTRASKTKLEWVSFSNTIYNVRSGVNNALSFTDAGGLHNITICPRAYNITDLCNEVCDLGSRCCDMLD